MILHIMGEHGALRQEAFEGESAAGNMESQSYVTQYHEDMF
jgi:hypothetical protein